MNELLSIPEQFKTLGMQASYHYACDYGSEWKLGRPLEQKALKLFDANPELQAEMRDIAKDFLWSLKSERPESHSQQDRKLSDGKVKTATGYVEDNTCTDKADFAPDLGSNRE